MKSLSTERISSGMTGLDEILMGGYVPNRAYLVRGGPGTGKTTLGLHFLIAGAMAGERTLFITLEEAEHRIRKNAEKMNLDLKGVEFLDLSPTSDYFSRSESYDIFSPSEVDREPMAARITEKIRELRPLRVFLDPMTQFRYLSGDVYQFRKQMLSFIRFLVDEGITLLFTSEGSPAAPDDDMQFMSDGVVQLTQSEHDREIQVFKSRGSSFLSGRHVMRLTDKGILIYPRLRPEAFGHEFTSELIPFGVPELDLMLCGGIERGTVTMITGPSGVGKTTLGMQFMKEAALRRERSVLYTFEEEVEIILRRCDGIGLPARKMIDQGNLSVVKVEPLQYMPDEFAFLVRSDLEKRNSRVVMIDSTAGYELTMRGADLKPHLHALTKYLQNMGAAVFLITETQEITGNFRISDLGISYLADNVIFLRFLEIHGEMRKAIGILKKRLSDYERKLREFEIRPEGIRIGPPMENLRGILLGTPEWIKAGQ